MKAVYLDPVERTITDIEIPDAELKTLKERLGCQWIERVNLGLRHEAFWIDEEGRINGNGERIGGFRFDNIVMAGRALVLDCDEEGEIIGTGLLAAQIEPHIMWLPPEWFATHPCPPPTITPISPV